MSGWVQLSPAQALSVCLRLSSACGYGPGAAPIVSTEPGVTGPGVPAPCPLGERGIPDWEGSPSLQPRGAILVMGLPWADDITRGHCCECFRADEVSTPPPAVSRFGGRCQDHTRKGRRVSGAAPHRWEVALFPFAPREESRDLE